MHAKADHAPEIMEVRSPHALVAPFPGQGHVIPLLEFSYCLIDHGFRITFVVTELAHDFITAAMPKTSVEDRQIRLVTITDGMAPGENRKGVFKQFQRFLEIIPEALEELIGSINEPDDDDKITCIITDGNMPGAVSVAQKMGIPTAAVWAASASSLATVCQIPRLIQDGILNVDGTVAKQGMIKLSPTLPAVDSTINYFWLRSGYPDVEKAFFQYLNHGSQDLKATDWLLCNSFYDIEQTACELIGRVMPIGPLIAGRRHGRLEGNFWPEDSTCLSWLDKQPAGSVIYVAFGSVTIFDRHQFQELALGLELSGKPFLWVVRSDLTDGSEDAYPEGFIARVANRGQIVGWSPQQKVLAHPAIACFFTHCGWNSTMEGLSNGVPFLCWPYNTDQFLNRTYITDVWKVGLEVKRESNGIISREEIKRKLDDLLGDKEISARSLELKALARKNVSEGGSSWKNFNNFIDAMKSKSC